MPLKKLLLRKVPDLAFVKDTIFTETSATFRAQAGTRNSSQMESVPPCQLRMSDGLPPDGLLLVKVLSLPAVVL